jgi:hypothetical protein
MQTARRRRTQWAIAASIVAHLGLLTAVLLQRPTLKIPVEPGGPPLAIIPLLIMPKTPAPLAGRGTRPAPIQLHRRPQRNLPAETPVAPLVVPTVKPAEAAPPAQAPVAQKAPQTVQAPPDAVRATLRATLGCNEAKIAGLSREDRAGCLERFGRGSRDDAYLPPALAPGKRAVLEEAGAQKMARKNAAELGTPADSLSYKAQPQDYSGEPDVATNAMPAHSHPPSKRAAKVLGPLPP